MVRGRPGPGLDPWGESLRVHRQSTRPVASNQGHAGTIGIRDTMNDVNPFHRLRAVPTAPDADQPEDPLAVALVAAGRGDDRAFAELYDLAAPLVHGIVLRVVPGPGDGRGGATQEVFVELWRLAPRYEAGRGSARAWIATMAHRRAVDRVRSEQARRNRDERDAPALGPHLRPGGRRGSSTDWITAGWNGPSRA